MKLIPKNWSEFQQYKDRKPLWIKFHRDLLNNFAYSSVQIGTKATLPLLWLLACEYKDGIIDATIEEISFRIHIDIKTLNTAIMELVTHDFFILEDNVQKCTESYKSVPREEKRQRREDTEKDTPLPYEEIINYLNAKLGTKYSTNGKANRNLIKARFNDGFKLEDFKTVINKKFNEWNGNQKMSVFLRPETLFSNKFEGYLNQVVTKSKLDISDIIYTKGDF